MTPHTQHPPSLTDEILLPALPGEVCGIGRLLRIIRKFPAEPLEVVGAFGMTALGLWFLWPGNDYPTAGVLQGHNQGGTRLWGLFFTALSLYKWWGVLWAYGHRIHRLIAAMLAGTGFSMIFMAYVRRSPHHAMVVVMALWVVQQAWIAYRSQRAWRLR